MAVTMGIPKQGTFCNSDPNFEEEKHSECQPRRVIAEVSLGCHCSKPQLMEDLAAVTPATAQWLQNQF